MELDCVEKYLKMTNCTTRKVIYYFRMSDVQGCSIKEEDREEYESQTTREIRIVVKIDKGQLTLVIKPFYAIQYQYICEYLDLFAGFEYNYLERRKKIYFDKEKVYHHIIIGLSYF